MALDIQILENLDRKDSDATIDPELLTIIRNSISDMLHNCGMHYPAGPFVYDHEFEEIVLARCAQDGIPLDGTQPFKQYIQLGVVMSRSAYPVIKDQDRFIYIALYTACVAYADDLYCNSTEDIADFNDRFMMNLPQKDAIMDYFARLLRGTSQLFDPIAASIIISTTIRFMTALMIECQMKDRRLSPSARSYPEYLRHMSGLPEAYGLFMFPAHIPSSDYIQALPDIVSFINRTNDMLSFYKEEAAGETTNCVSMLAQVSGLSKHTVIQDMNECNTDAYLRVLKTLGPHRDAYDAFAGFPQGFLLFHAGSSGRYRLHELQL